ncbi:hypothetical protein RND81_06G053900 [Saponaria officinalis]|uniref:Hsp70-interacting protein N-terminal domain-containing protein n=1 Tax=Saponaria officinalis TaxID=3572 RepID=A0AAW1K6A3_SAPOF
MTSSMEVEKIEEIKVLINHFESGPSLLHHPSMAFFRTYISDFSKAAYWNMVIQSMYDKLLDIAKGTLLHLCDDVIQQKVLQIKTRY